ncbi:MAG: hypothetical protein IPO88_14035 [Nannocystis sp.]|nr:hypothetical protein [Nannocystis sp.]
MKKAAKVAAGKTVAKKVTAKKTAAKKAAKVPAKKAATKKAAPRVTAKVTKKAATKVSAKKAPAKVPAKKAAAAAKVTAKVTAKAAAKVTPTKAAAKVTPTKAAAKVTPTKAATKVTPKQAAPAATTGALSGWLQRLNAAIAALQAHPEVDVVANWQAPGATAAQLDAVEAKLGLKLDPAIRNLYQQVNGLALVWGPKGECPRSVKGRPTMMYIESLWGSRGAIFLYPIGEVFGVKGRPTFDYAQFMPGDPPHWGFDFPGNFYTPAFVQVGDELRVRVGDDHGAAWDGPTVSFERYLENVLASWGSIDQRAEQFVTGKGAAIKPMQLAKLLA